MNYLVGTQPANTDFLVAADMNKDGIVDVADLVRLASYIKGEMTISGDIIP